MLSILDAILTFFFQYVPPLVAGLGTIAFALLAVGFLLRVGESLRFIEVAAGCLTLSAMSYSFFPYLKSVEESADPSPTTLTVMPDGSTQVVPLTKGKIAVNNNTVAIGLVLLSGVAVVALRAVMFSYVPVALIVWGVILFGW